MSEKMSEKLVVNLFHPKPDDKVFVDFRLINTPFIHPDKVVIGVLENCKQSAIHMISDYYLVQKANHIIFIMPDVVEEQIKEDVIRSLPSLSTISFMNAESALKLYPDLLEPNETISFPSPSTFSLILPNLYISDMYFAHKKELLSSLSISAIINLAPDVAENKFQDLSSSFTYLSLHVQDNAKTDISKYFEITKRFIDKYRKTGGVLVHCAAGISRSATIVIAYIMKTLHLPFQNAFTFVQERHPIADPNLNFLIQLMKYE